MSLRQQRLLPLIIACALFIENMDSTVISTSLPAIANDLGTEPIALKLALTAYLLALAVFIPISGWVADRFGGRRTFITAIAVFLLGSVCCAASVSLETMVVARFLQGMGGAMMVPVGRLILLRSVPKAQLVNALSWVTIPALVGPMVGPPLGGFITTYFDWRWIFLINIPMGLLGMVMARRFIPDLKEEPVPLDAMGFLLSGIGLAAAMFGFSTLGRHQVPTGWALAMLALGIGLLLGYVWHARRHPRPLLDLRLFRVPTYRAGVLGGMLFRIGIGATPFLLPLMLQLGFGLSPVQSGLLTFVSAAGAMFMKTIAARVLKRFGFRRVLIANALIASAMLCGFGLFRPTTPHVFILATLFVSGCFRSLQFTSLNAISYADVDAPRMSQASSLAGMMQQLSLSLGVAIGGYILEIVGWINHRPETDVHNFYIAFVVVGFISASSAWMMWRLPGDAGAEMAGRAEAGKELADPKPNQLPAT
ncbi:DHA2 family efflux MFS transporter permease subunit [Pseudoxanthomonas dokdonensis]|uniref:Major facilitator transporter n=1 Tax=Pseudoxanthomonas dokdonensis TaxID=344882 RepID=A0A0R0CRQ1_9GAMM|nr:DHA2 family efflux MFS transporter permease subunit [Pseudoxanthomonas dokdonensis]KRG68970.1 major facilitator transporter [Pseudoxanthomonas dokdonensis]